MGLLFKVLVDGRSCHGGDFSWSLPQGAQPGDWHEVDAVEMCRQGFHLTDWPPRWWLPTCAIYVVEAEGVLGDASTDADRKCVAKKVRLLRLASDAELAAVGVFLSGSHVFRDNATGIASGSASVEAYDSASVEAYDSASVEAYGSASVEAYDSASVEAYDSASVEAYGSASVKASGSASVKASGSASVEAKDRVVVTSWRGKEGIRIEGPRTVAVIYPGFWCDEMTVPEVLTASGKLVPETAGKPKRKLRKARAR